MGIAGTMVALATLGACTLPGDEAPPGFRIVNETARDLRIVSDLGLGRVLHASASGGDASFFLDGCSDHNLTASWPDGRLVDVLAREYCSDQAWVITGVNQSRVR